LQDMKPFRFADERLNAEIGQVATRKTFPASHLLMSPGDVIRFIPLVLKGSIRIMLQNEEGGEYFLYHIFPGETCALSLTCCQAQKRSSVKAVMEEDTELLMIPVRYVDEWSKYPEWKKFVSDVQAQRFSELLETIELMAFSKLDEQLWNYLIKRVQATGNNTLKVTHQEIANELHSPREVITRLLHQLQNKKKIMLSRNSIRVNGEM
jgi:CRP/FNR family transcriptional regulator, anaerobic regulatory protein